MLTAWLLEHSNNKVSTSGSHFACACDAVWLNSCQCGCAGASLARLPLDLWPCVVRVTHTFTRASICTGAGRNSRTIGKSCPTLDQETQVRTSGRVLLFNKAQGEEPQLT